MAEEPQVDQGQIQEPQLAEQLTRLVQAIQASGKAILPRSSDALLQSIVEAAARIFSAGAASIALVNEQEQTLEFKVSVGPSNDIIGKSIPINKGIAGYVAMTGQPIAVSNVDTDPRFNREFSKSTGYVPTSILATPLLLGERVIGVMEILDKISAASFGLQDMELLGMFAHQAALAINQAQQMERLTEALALGLERLAASDLNADSGELLSVLEKSSREQPESRDILALADLFNQISSLGATERRACLKMLGVFAEYSRAKSKSFSGGKFR